MQETQSSNKDLYTRTPACGVCGKQSRKLLRCDRCEYARYCDKNCQKRDEARHKPDCDTIHAQLLDSRKLGSEELKKRRSVDRWLENNRVVIEYAAMVASLPNADNPDKDLKSGSVVIIRIEPNADPEAASFDTTSLDFGPKDMLVRMFQGADFQEDSEQFRKLTDTDRFLEEESRRDHRIWVTVVPIMIRCLSIPYTKVVLLSVGREEAEEIRRGPVKDALAILKDNARAQSGGRVYRSKETGDFVIKMKQSRMDAPAAE